MNLTNDTHVLIMAAGKGTRMRSLRPKALHTLRGAPLIDYVCSTVQATFGDDFTVVLGHSADEIAGHLGKSVRIVNQKEQLGTGHAVRSALPVLLPLEPAQLVVLPGDHPFVTPLTLRALVAKQKTNGVAVTIATVSVPNFLPPYDAFWSSGRIVTDGRGRVLRIVEHKDAEPQEITIPEVNVSYYVFDFPWLCENIERIKPANSQNEFYLTDLVELAAREGGGVSVYRLPDWVEGLGVNTPEELERLESLLSLRTQVPY